MKKFFVVLALLSAMVLMISCGGGSRSTASIGELGGNCYTNNTCDRGLICDIDSNVCVEDPKHPIDDSDKSDSGSEVEPDTGSDSDGSDSAPDNGDTTPDGGDTAPDNGDTEQDNDYPQTPCDPNPCISDSNSTGVCTINNDSYICGCIDGYIFDGTLCIKSLPKCSPANETPCIDSATGLIWSAKSENKMPWNDAVNYCQNLTEGDFNNWRLPSIAVLRTLVQNCSSEKCTDDYTGKYSKFGDTVYLWSSSEGEDSTAQSIYFSDASTQPVSIDANVNVRCVRREAESRQSNCTGLIENSVWNTATQITQTWDWEAAAWTPSSEGGYNTAESSSECRFICDSNSFWEASSEKCSNPCKPNPCYSNSTTGICVGKSAEEYTCECRENYFWDGSSKCLNPCEPNPCNTIGETGICLSQSAKEYTCECENNYVWTPYRECIKNLCLENSCDIPNSTGVCNPVNETQYACECDENYYWWGENRGCVNRKPALGNICTGQDKCYNNSETMVCPAEGESFFGQDAQYAETGTCASQSFTVQTISSQKVVLDNNTGLMWQQTIRTEESSWVNNDCHLLTYAGYSDWRLPTPQELLTIVDNGRFGPAIDTTYFPDTPGAWFWSSSSDEHDISSAWYVNFGAGNVHTHHKSSKYLSHVRCVRGSTLASSFNSSSVNGDEIVTDTKTGLVWQKSYVSGKTWQEALSYCEDLTYAGYSEWRLPNKNELASLVNYEKYASDFPDMPSAWFWSSSTYAHNSNGAWYVYFNDGYVNYDDKTVNVYVRCVR